MRVRPTRAGAFARGNGERGHEVEQKHVELGGCAYRTFGFGRAANDVDHRAPIENAFLLAERHGVFQNLPRNDLTQAPVPSAQPPARSGSKDVSKGNARHAQGTDGLRPAPCKRLHVRARVWRPAHVTPCACGDASGLRTLPRKMMRWSLAGMAVSLVTMALSSCTVVVARTR